MLSNSFQGMIEAAKCCRVNKVPYLGICLGMQVSVIEFARHVVGITEATSSEFNARAKDPVIIPMEELDKEVMGMSSNKLAFEVVWMEVNEESRWHHAARPTTHGMGAKHRVEQTPSLIHAGTAITRQQ